MCAKAGRPFSVNPKSIEIKARITPLSYEKIKDEALKKKISISSVIRLALDAYFDDNKKQ